MILTSPMKSICFPYNLMNNVTITFTEMIKSNYSQRVTVPIDIANSTKAFLKNNLDQ